jgi:hypothetical protein
MPRKSTKQVTSETKIDNSMEKKETPVKQTAGANETPVKQTAGANETPVKQTAGANETPVKQTAGANETPVKQTAGANETPVKQTVDANETPVKQTTGAKKTKTTKVNTVAKTATKGTKVAKLKKSKTVDKVSDVVIATTTEGLKKKTRYFKCMYSGVLSGRFCGNKPKQAANKALTSIVKDLKDKGLSVDNDIVFSIIECTRKSRKKEYNYSGRRIKLDTPMKVKIGGGDKIIEYNYNNKIQKIKPEISVTTKNSNLQTTSVKKTTTANIVPTVSA